MGKAVTKQEAGLPAEFMEEMAADAGDGLQTITTDDMAVPFLRILQKMSPQTSKRDGKYVEGAEDGMIFNTVTGQIWEPEAGLEVIPCAFNHKNIVWRSREDGGGLVSTHARGEVLPKTTKDDRGRDITEDGGILTPTAEHYVMLVHPDGSMEQAIMALSSTQLKYSRRWTSIINQQTMATAAGTVAAPMYSRVYSLKTITESNDHGEWNSWDIKLERVLDNIEQYRTARTFSKAVNAGTVQAKHVGDDEPAASAENVM